MIRRGQRFAVKWISGRLISIGVRSTNYFWKLASEGGILCPGYSNYKDYTWPIQKGSTICLEYQRNGDLCFIVNEINLGVAFKGLHQKLVPFVNVSLDTEVEIIETN